jgi:hypothetical protein
MMIEGPAVSSAQQVGEIVLGTAWPQAVDDVDDAERAATRLYDRPPGAGPRAQVKKAWR